MFCKKFEVIMNTGKNGKNLRLKKSDPNFGPINLRHRQPQWYLKNFNKISFRDHPFKTSAFFSGGGVKNWPLPTAHSDLGCRIVSKKDLQTSVLGQENLITWHLKLLMDAFWIIKSSFSLSVTTLARTQQENYPKFFMIFQFSPVYVPKMQEKVFKS